MLNSGPNLAAPLDGPRPFGQVASAAGRSHFEQLPARLLRLPDPRMVDAGPSDVGTTFRAATIAGTRIRIRPTPQVTEVSGSADQIPGTTVQFKARTAQVAVFGAGVPKTIGTKASELLFRSQGGENPFPPIFQVANEMTETQPRQARSAAGSVA